MKEIVNLSGKTDNLTVREFITAVIPHIVTGILCLAASKAVVLDKLLPFGLSFLAGSPLSLTPAAAIGAFLGYFIPAVGNGAFRYIAALFAILAVKLLLGNYKSLVSNPYFLTLTALLAGLFTGAVSLKGGLLTPLEFITESLLCGAGAYFSSLIFRALKKETVAFTAEELCAFIIMLGILLMGFNSISFNGVSLGRILAVCLILICAKYGGTVSGAISGTTVALTLTLSGSNSAIGVAFAFAGLMAGVFSSLGKYAQITVITLFSLIGSVSSGDVVLISLTVIETAMGAALFLTLPRKAGTYIGKFLSAQPHLSIPSGVKKSLTMRLDMASNALRDVSETVEQVSEELSRINSPDFSSVFAGVEKDACVGCKLRVHCWETKRDDTIAALLEMTKAIKQGENSPEAFAGEEFKGRCLKPSSVGNSCYRHYSEYTSRIAAESRIDEVRGVVSDQFNGISDMLSDLSQDFKSYEKFDTSTADRVASALKNLDIRVDEASCRIDKYGRMALDFKLKKAPELVINKAQVIKVASAVCERDFDIPNISQIGKEIFMTLNERAAIAIDIGADQIAAADSNMCGDAYKYFYDGRGHFIMVLSDGMGTGGRAAVDGAMASGLMSRLIKAGFGYDCSLKILNSSMLFKSTDESLATVDIASVDLFTGMTELYKAGAAPTVVRRSGKTGRAESSSLPAGILRDIDFDRAAIKCRVGDIILLMSDGVTGTGTDWIRAELEAWGDGTAQELAERICECAKRRRNDDHEDDITVLAAILNKTL